MSEQVSAELAAGVEYGLRFLPPHKNAGESVWVPSLQVAVQIRDGLSELVTRRVGPWEPITIQPQGDDCGGCGSPRCDWCGSDPDAADGMPL